MHIADLQIRALYNCKGRRTVEVHLRDRQVLMSRPRLGQMFWLQVTAVSANQSAWDDRNKRKSLSTFPRCAHAHIWPAQVHILLRACPQGTLASGSGIKHKNAASVVARRDGCHDRKLDQRPDFAQIVRSDSSAECQKILCSSDHSALGATSRGRADVVV